MPNPPVPSQDKDLLECGCSIEGALVEACYVHLGIIGKDVAEERKKEGSGWKAMGKPERERVLWLLEMLRVDLFCLLEFDQNDSRPSDLPQILTTTLPLQLAMLPGPPKESNVLSLFRLNGKVAVVTGGTRGIGWEASQAMAEAGADVAIIYTSYPNPEDRVAEIEALGVKCRSYKSSTNDPKAIDLTLHQILQDFGKIDIVIANAGINQHTKSLEYTPEYWKHEMDVNVNGSFFTAQSAGKIFRSQGFGNLLFTASISGTIVNVPQCQAAYNAAKAAVIQMAKSLAVEWVDFARVNTLSPGYVRTDMTVHHEKEKLEEWDRRTPARRMAEASELKGGFLYLVSDASSYTTGIDLIIDGGYTAV